MDKMGMGEGRDKHVGWQGFQGSEAFSGTAIKNPPVE